MNIDPHSATWRSIMDWADKELNRQREDLEFLTVSEKQADQCRGAIEQLKKLQKLPKLMKPAGFNQP